MVPYYSDDLCTIYRGDCLDVLPEVLTDPVACVLQDPPYASGTRSEAGKSSSGAMVRGERFANRPIDNDQMTTAGFVWLMRQVCSLLAPRMVEGASMLCFIDWRQWPNLLGAVESTNLRANNMLVWDKVHLGMGQGFRLQHELILHASRGVPNVSDRSVGNVLQAKRVENSEHPSPKPEGLLEALLKVTTKPGDLVVDPFMGCGATPVAAKNLGRRAICIELQERYCEVAARRLSQGALSLEGAS